MGKFGKDGTPAGVCQNCGQPSQEILGVILDDNYDLKKHPDAGSLPYMLIKKQWYLILLFERKGRFNIPLEAAGLIPKKGIDEGHHVIVNPEGLTVRYVATKDSVACGVVKDTFSYQMSDTADANVMLEVGEEGKQAQMQIKVNWEEQQGVEYAYIARLNELWILKK